MLIRSDRTSDNKKIKRLLFVVVGLMIFAMIAPSVVRFVAGIVLYPVIQLENWFANSTQVLPTLWRDKIVMQSDIDRLEQELAVSKMVDLSQQRLFDENNRLRSLLRASTTQRIAAVVIGKPGELPYDLIQIDRGSSDGVEVGSPVFIGKDAVIGMVSTVQNNSSFVTLFTTPDFLTTVYLSGADVTAVLEGLGGGVARVKVPQGIVLRVDDLVHIPSIQPGVFGTIAWVESEPTQPEQFGYITPNIPISSLFQVAVGSPAVVSTDPEIAQTYIDDIQRDMLVIPQILTATTTATSTEQTATSTEQL